MFQGNSVQFDLRLSSKHILCIITLLVSDINFSFANINQDSLDIVSWQNRDIETLNDLDEISALVSNSGYLYGLEGSLCLRYRIYEAAKNLKVDSIAAHFASHVGNYFFNKDSLSKAIQYYTEALKLGEGIDDPVFHGKLNNMVGNVLTRYGQWEEAMEFFVASMEAFGETNSNQRSYPLGNISDLYERMGDYEKSLEYNLKTMAYSKQMEGDEYDYNYGFDCYRHCKLYTILGKMDSAQYYLEKSIEIVKDMDINVHRFRELKYLAFETATYYYLKKGDLEQAENYLKEAEEIVLDILISDFLILKGNFYLQSGDRAKTLEIANIQDLETVNFVAKQKHLAFKIKAFEHFNLYEETVAAYREMDELNTQKFGKDKAQYTQFFNAMLEVELKQLKIEDLEKQQKIIATQNENRKAWLITSFALIFSMLLGIISIAYFLRQKHSFNQKLKHQVEKKTEDLIQLNHKLENQNTELQRFSFVVSHDLKEPLRSIVSFSNILQKKIKDQNALEYLGYVIKAGKQLHRLIEDIRCYQDTDKMELEQRKISLIELLEQIKEEFRPIIQAKRANVIFENGSSYIETDPTALYLILKNLIANSLEYNDHTQPLVEVKCQENQSYVWFDVKDNGIGIKEEYFDYIFEPFRRLNDRNYEGSGIGLSICHKLTDRLGGIIRVLRSELGKGTVVRILFPKEKDNSHKKAVQGATNKSLPTYQEVSF